jgi:hypothetical protein
VAGFCENGNEPPVPMENAEVFSKSRRTLLHGFSRQSPYRWPPLCPDWLLGTYGLVRLEREADRPMSTLLMRESGPPSHDTSWCGAQLGTWTLNVYLCTCISRLPTSLRCRSLIYYYYYSTLQPLKFGLGFPHDKCPLCSVQSSCSSSFYTPIPLKSN